MGLCMLWKKHRPDSAQLCAQCLLTSCCTICVHTFSLPGSSGVVCATTLTNSEKVSGQ